MTRPIDSRIEDVLSILGDEVEYWKERCKLAEKCLEENPCDPDMTTNQIVAYDEYRKFLEENGNG